MSGVHDLAAAALRLVPPETAHRLTLGGLRLGLGPRATVPPDPVLATTLAKLRLAHPLGLAAGFDKDGVAPGQMLAAGFAFVEVGTVTPRPQTGSARPRLFRLPKDKAVINRMGFNNRGMKAVARRWPNGSRGPIGVNIGANKDSADLAADYVACLETLWGRPDWFTLNVSSPNTPGLRALQSGDALEHLLGRVSEARARLRGAADPPLLLKVAPDLDDKAIEAVVEAAIRFGLDGLIVGNTTVGRPRGLASRHAKEAGGLSGAPLMRLATERLRAAHEVAARRLPLIGAGGVSSAADILDKIRAGASAVQVYTALVYQGSGIAVAWSRELAAMLRAEGFRGVAEAVGTA